MKALTHKLLRDLWRLRGQGLAIALIVASGVAVLVMSLTAIDALRESARGYYDRYLFADVFATAKRAPLRLADRIAQVPGVQIVEPRVSWLGQVDRRDFPEPIIARFLSLPQRGEPRLNRLVIRSGAYPEPEQADQVVVAESFAEAHDLGPGDPLTVILAGRRMTLRIAGVGLSPEFVYAIGPGALMPDDARFAVLWMRRDALAAAVDMEGAFNDLVLGLGRGIGEAGVLAAVDGLLAPFGGTDAHGRDDQVSNWFLMNEIEQLETLASLLPAIFLTVAAYLSNMVLARLIAIERPEIGLLKAFGYGNLAIAWHYTQLVLVLGIAGVCIGWIAGLYLGHWTTEIYGDFYRFPALLFRPQPAVFVLSAAVSLAAALVGAVFAARRAAQLPPAEAMRPPAPPAFRRHGWLAAAVIGVLDQPTRIILRQLLRRPLRATLTVVGIAASAGVLITALQWLDAIDALADSFYRDQQRQSLTIGLVEAREAGVVGEALALPGVLAAEGHRTVAARLHFGHRSRRQAVIGASANGGLEQLRDSRGKALVLPPSGLLMSTALAKRLAVGVGDAVFIEILEGRRPRFQVPVAMLFETDLGTPVYMDIAALTAAIGERDTVNQLLLLTDPAEEASLFSALKDLPSIGAAVLKRAALAQFEDTIGDTILIYTSFYVVFACTLAFGVIYNNLRIALSERGRELATLRVLGFHRSEISYILLGEAALLVLFALPLGCLMGLGLAALLAQGFESELFRVPLAVSRATYGTAACVVVLAALFSGYHVKRRIDGLDLIAVLKTRE